MLNSTLKRALAAGAATLTLAGGAWAATDMSAHAVQRQGGDGGAVGTRYQKKKPGAKDFGSAGQQAMKSKMERDAGAAARRAGGQGPANGYRYDSGRGTYGGGGNPFQHRGGCGRPCSKAM